MDSIDIITAAVTAVLLQDKLTYADDQVMKATPYQYANHIIMTQFLTRVNAEMNKHALQFAVADLDIDQCMSNTAQQLCLDIDAAAEAL